MADYAGLFDGGFPESAYYPQQWQNSQGRFALLESTDCELIIRQQPLRGKVAVATQNVVSTQEKLALEKQKGESTEEELVLEALETYKDLKTIDPIPIVELKVSEARDPNGIFMTSPYLFMTCSLVMGPEDPQPLPGSTFVGELTSSIHRLQNEEKDYCGFFLWTKISPKFSGHFCLRFDLFQVRGTECVNLGFVVSNFLTVYERGWPGYYGSSPLVQYFKTQGIKVRLNREPKRLLKADGPASENYAPKRPTAPKRRSAPKRQKRQDVDAEHEIDDFRFPAGQQSGQ